uniref:Helicase ATP-binding domain-containing protein n=1 Tax=viral metagenome TaxID=1070528 RepID=A0A6C0I482_9ZZZZ
MPYRHKEEETLIQQPDNPDTDNLITLTLTQQPDNTDPVTRYKMSKSYEEFANRAGIDVKGYQVEGVSWCIEREQGAECLGGIVADEMGLGKTIMMISLLILNFVPRTLIIVPPPLISQWESEIYRTTGHRAFVYHGSNKKELRANPSTYYPIVIATYAAIAESKKGQLDRLHNTVWDRVIFDEAHHLRNSGCNLNGARLLKATRRWFITGTPIQNSAKDFMNLCSALHVPASLSLQEIVATYLLRRTKKDVGIILPPVTMQNVTVPWISKKEKRLASLVHLGAVFGGGIKIQQMLRSRQMCIYPPILQKLDLSSDYDYLDECSSKMDVVVQTLLERQGNGNGKLVFCHFREEIEVLVERLTGRSTCAGDRIKVAVYDGTTSKKDKLQILQKDNECEVLILQIQTGCEGLNLQHGFNEVYFVSPHWNPAVEDQAVARCHRIGQEKEVFVFRFRMDSYCEKKEEKEGEKGEGEGGDVIESYINDVQTRKREIYKVIDVN